MRHSKKFYLKRIETIQAQLDVLLASILYFGQDEILPTSSNGTICEQLDCAIAALETITQDY